VRRIAHENERIVSCSLKLLPLVRAMGVFGLRQKGRCPPKPNRRPLWVKLGLFWPAHHFHTAIVETQRRYEHHTAT
jgi:hypothetical protein